MPSSCAAGVCSPEQNGSKKHITRTATNNRFRGSHESHYQSNSKVNRTVKYVRARIPGESLHYSQLDGTQYNPDRQNTKVPLLSSQLSGVHSQPDGLLPDTGSVVDSRHATNQSNRMAVVQQNVPISTTECLPSAVTNHTTNANLTTSTATNVYDASTHGYIANYPGYVPTISCTIPNCTGCYPPVNPLSYGSGFVPGSVYPDASSTGSNCPMGTPCYVLINQDTEMQKQLYQTQWAMSNLNLNGSTCPTLPAEYAVGVPVIQSSSTDAVPNQEVIAHNPNFAYCAPPTTSLQSMDQASMSDGATPNVSHSVTPATFTSDCTPALVLTNNGVVNANYTCPNQPSFASVPTDGRSPCTSDAVGLPVSADPTPSITSGSSNISASGLNVVTNGDTMWAANSCYGQNSFWFPPGYTNYAPPYYQPMTVPVASISPNSLLNLSDSGILSLVDRYRSPTYSLNDKLAVSMPDYYMSGPSVPLAPAFTNTVVPKPSLQTAPTLNHSAVYPSHPVASSSVQPSQWLNAARWQWILNALAVSKYSSGEIPSHRSFVSHALDRRRAVANTSLPVIPPKAFDPGDLVNPNFSINPIDFDESLLFRARFFVIKSDCEHNVRQSIQHGVWCSTRAGNQCLEEAFQSVQATKYNNSTQSFDRQSTTDSTDRAKTVSTPGTDSIAHQSGHVLLFFSIRSSGCLNGVAEMIGPVNPEKRVLIWEDPRFKGEIPVRWIYVKNVSNNLIKHICVEAYENRPVTALRDTSEIRPASKGEELLRIVHSFGLNQFAKSVPLD